MKTKTIAKNYGLGFVLLALFLISWAAQGMFQWQEFVSNAQQHNQPVQVSEFTNEFLAATFENWQSEFLQLFAMVTLTSFLIFKGSAESRDSEDRIEKKITEIESMLKKQKRK